MSNYDKQKLSNLIISVAKGSSEALDGVYYIAARHMTAVALSVVGSRADADDVVSDSFIKIAKFAHKYTRAYEPMAWILKIVRNTALDYLRAAKRRNTVDIDKMYSIADESVSLEKKLAAYDLENALSKLSEDERKVIVLRYFHDMTVREIAKVTGLSRSSAERLIEKAEKNLKNLLSRE